ncbi:bifunctional phosphopantothenoylcysteine decarboxylase/phosphopantothenate--cysteine ligase CoaBC [Ghiorsea bivora]|uniref:bifunctional phosphopantothenoylcysteine decarboxylase/phosphopantothenate--cysteine ligase CoaBC n=1 Tax=Ghiorsea bivora TaxID=1485545 RepID=UPI00056FD303|nr:bifunctional phosphopantothenoylcysteine decarboxylase/phosphopantothenate--cysteine ligase CoaBC [Ghiorsea bivora]
MLKGKRILLGVGGGIAVYRAVELMRLFIKQGAEVQVVMTKSATEFVTPLTFEALSGNKVHTDLFDLTEQHGMGHIQLVRWADAVVLAPVTSNLLAKITHGIADDLLTTLMLANEKPVLLAPAMNVSMWLADATQRNVNMLKERACAVVEPATGELACGEQGSGRLAEPARIVQNLLPLLTKQVLKGQHWVINAGPTVEAWDAVRTMSNRASGGLGAMLADAAAIQGASVCLVAGKGTPKTRQDVERVDVESAAEMMHACVDAAQGVDVFVGTAAVSDFRFAKPLQHKLKRQGNGNIQVELIENPDIVAAVATMKQRPLQVIAFAAESENHVGYAQDKLQRKGVDAIVANDVSNMGNNLASGWWVSKQNQEVIKRMPKAKFAKCLIQFIHGLQDER